MFRVLFGIFVVLHGLVHLWYVVLSRRLVEFQADMGWTGESWLFSPLFGDGATRWLATHGFVAGGIGVFAHHEWWRPLVIGSAAVSAVAVLLFWDGGLQLLVQKGLIGFLINVAFLVALFVFRWPSADW
jgi:hypothetical protein